MNSALRVEVEQSRHNQQNQALHEDEETRYEGSIIQKRVGKRDVSSHQNPADNPYPLTFPVPHLLQYPG